MVTAYAVYVLLVEVHESLFQPYQQCYVVSFQRYLELVPMLLIPELEARQCSDKTVQQLDCRFDLLQHVAFQRKLRPGLDIAYSTTYTVLQGQPTGTESSR